MTRARSCVQAAGEHLVCSYNLIENAEMAQMFGMEGRHFNDRQRTYGQDVLFADGSGSQFA